MPLSIQADDANLLDEDEDSVGAMLDTGSDVVEEFAGELDFFYLLFPLSFPHLFHIPHDWTNPALTVMLIRCTLLGRRLQSQSSGKANPKRIK